MSDMSEKLEIIYQNASPKPTLAVTGAFGGVAPPHWAVVAHVYVEHPTVPNITSHHVEEDGSVNTADGESIKRGDITREVQATLVFSAEAARSMGEWLIKHSKASLLMREKEGS